MSEQEEKLRQRIVAVFRGEAQERIAALSSGLDGLAHEAAETHPARIEAMFREAHSLKAAARAVDELEMEAICQSVETVFAGLRRGELALSDRLREALMACVDTLADLAATIGTARNEARRTRAIGVSHALQAALRGEPRVAPAPPTLAAEPAVPETVTPEERVARASPTAGDTVRLAQHRLGALLLLAESILADKLTVARLAADLKKDVASFAEGRRERRDPGAVMAELQSRIETTHGAVANEAHALGLKVDELLFTMKQILTQPCTSIVQPFPRAVRELARELGKDVSFTVTGAELEIDRRILQELKDPLLHLLRNCVDHGVEKPAARLAAGKPARASIALRIVTQDGDKVEFQIADDGAGVATEKLAAVAVRHGILSAERAASAGAAELMPLIFQSGVSTSPIITDLSGRGLGLAIVRETVERLGGSVAVDSHAGRGTVFRLIVPRSLAIYRGIAVRLGDRLMIVPTFSAERVLRIEPAAVYRVDKHAMIDVEGSAVRLVALRDVLELPAEAPRESERRWRVALLVALGAERVAFEVDEVEGDQEILIKPLGKCLKRVRNIQGAAILASGLVAPVLNAQDLIKSAARLRPAAAPRAAPEKPVVARPKSILIAEDSITARGLLRNILELAGYRIKIAVDGMEAWSMLKLEPFDLLVSDVEMPRMNGFELTARIRADAILAELPVVLVTALESREHIERGVDIGANAYILKGGFDQSRLLEAVRRLA